MRHTPSDRRRPERPAGDGSTGCGSRVPRRLLALGLALATVLVALAAAVTAPRPAEAVDASVPVYRLYNRWNGTHNYTVDKNEHRTLIAAGWKDEGVAFKTPATGRPIYRLYNRFNGDHFYTPNTVERDAMVKSGWTSENVGFYASTEATAYPIKRLYNPYMTADGGRGNHLWTSQTSEYDVNVNRGWRGEGFQWYATGPSEPPVPTTPLDIHGALQVKGTSLADKYGNPFQLRGMSTHGLSFTEEQVPFKDYVNYEAFRTLRDDWGANCVRLAMYTENYMGYCNGGNKEELKNVVRRGVNDATDLGMYVIVDWHILENGNPAARQGDAIDFFRQMSGEFRDHQNVIYEICNEPNGGVDWWTVKGYAESVIPVIRANDPDAIVIVGTPTWSQDIHLASQNPLTGDVARNTMYALHFYANTHKHDFRNRLNAALDAGLPVFISEFGTCDASGNGGYDFGEAQRWIDLANSRNVSWVNWSLCLKRESASAIQPWCRKTSGWETWELTESGNWVRNQMRAAAGL